MHLNAAHPHGITAGQQHHPLLTIHNPTDKRPSDDNAETLYRKDSVDIQPRNAIAAAAALPLQGNLIHDSLFQLRDACAGDRGYAHRGHPLKRRADEHFLRHLCRLSQFARCRQIGFRHDEDTV